MHRQDAIYLDQLCPKISNKIGENHSINLLNINVFIAVNHQNHLITFTLFQKEAKVIQAIVYHVVCLVMGKNQTQKF